jgi:phage-related protein
MSIKYRRNNMNVHHYTTSGGKDLILDYIDRLPKNEKAAGLTILDKLENEGLVALDVLNTRQLRGKLWEIKFYDDNRIMYIVADMDNIYLIHACKKQKGKAEKFELDKAIKRVKELESILGKRFV